jgi:hypothetical protein
MCVLLVNFGMYNFTMLYIMYILYINVFIYCIVVYRYTSTIVLTKFYQNKDILPLSLALSFINYLKKNIYEKGSGFNSF